MESNVNQYSENKKGQYHFSLLTENELKLPYYLVGAGWHFHQELDPYIRPEGYPHFQWIQCIEGKGFCEIDGVSHNVGPGQSIFIFPNVPHQYKGYDNQWIVNWFTFNGYHIEELLQIIGISSSGIYDVEESEFLSGKILHALKLIKSSDTFRGFEGSVLVYEFIMDLMKFVHQGDSPPVGTQYRKLDPVLKHIDLHYSQVLTIDDLSGLVSVSPQHLCSLFKKLLKRRPFEYINSVRINKSKEFLLNNPDISVGEIARLCGFENASYFSRVFRSQEGINPRQFRLVRKDCSPGSLS